MRAFCRYLCVVSEMSVAESMHRAGYFGLLHRAGYFGLLQFTIAATSLPAIGSYGLRLQRLPALGLPFAMGDATTSLIPLHIDV